MIASSEISGFSTEQQQLYKKRFNEGYNLLINTDYVRWLGLYLPEFCPSESESVVSLFSDISPEERVAVFGHTIATPNSGTVAVASSL